MIKGLFAVFLVAVSANFVAHEWGTFTSLQGSNGVPQAGLEHTEHLLPNFVSNQAGKRDEEHCAKGKRDTAFVASTPTEVTQKLETPVIYFYTQKKMDVEVQVAFPEGLVTEFYPQPRLLSPSVGANVASVSRGVANWKVQVSPSEMQGVPAVADDNIWAPSRYVRASWVHDKKFNETEEFIFYRGLGKFNGPVKVTSDEEHIMVKSLSDEDIPAAFLLVSSGNGGYVQELGPIKARGAIKTSAHHCTMNKNPKMLSEGTYMARASVFLENALRNAGLTSLEARAMVDTWTHSYFKSKGIRILYIAPKSYPDALLPWKMIPAPTSETRVYVGRVELILKKEEDKLRSRAKKIVMDNDFSGAEQLKTEFGRFAESKVRATLRDEELGNAERNIEHLFGGC